jgi:hypothetical protein
MCKLANVQMQEHLKKPLVLIYWGIFLWFIFPQILQIYTDCFKYFCLLPFAFCLFAHRLYRFTQIDILPFALCIFALCLLLLCLLRVDGTQIFMIIKIYYDLPFAFCILSFVFCLLFCHKSTSWLQSSQKLLL